MASLCRSCTFGLYGPASRRPLRQRVLGLFVYRSLTRASADRDADFVFRLSIVAIAMALPGIITLVLALADHRKGAFSTVSKVGLMLGILSLGLVFLPIRGVVERATRARNLALSGRRGAAFLDGGHPRQHASVSTSMEERSCS